MMKLHQGSNTEIFPLSERRSPKRNFVDRHRERDMITTVQEYRVAQKNVEVFTATLNALCARPIVNSEKERRSLQIDREGLESLLADIKQEIEEYEYLTQTPIPVIEVSSFRDIGKSLVKGRLA